jgi:hypothetical protein
MLAFEQSTNPLPILRPSALYPIHHSTVSVHDAKEGYDYPLIRLPRTLSKLAGLPTQIYQTLHEGALAFLVVVSGSSSLPENVSDSPESSALTQRQFAKVTATIVAYIRRT